MKLAFSTNAFTNGVFTIIDAINKIADAGYSGVEILMDRPLVWPFEASQKEIEAIKNVLKERKMEISSLNAFTCCGYWVEAGKQKRPPGQKFGPCFCDYEEEYREQRIVYTKKVIDLAVELDAKDISTCSGYQPLRGTRIMAWKNMIKGLKEVVKYAEEKNIRLNIEYEPGCLVGSAFESAKIVAEIDSPNFGLNFDIGHSFVCNEDVVDTIKFLNLVIPNKIHSTHIEDIELDDKGRPIHYHEIPCYGQMPLKEIFQAFKDIGYQGWYTVELYTYFKKPIYATRKSIKFLTELGKLI